MVGNPLRHSAGAFLLAALVLLPLAAGAHMGAEGVVKHRMMMMTALGKAMKDIKRALEDGNAQRVGAATEHIAHHARKLASLFPAGSGGGVSEASPRIWEDPTGFREHADALVDAAEKLRAAARTSEPAATRAAFRETGQTCSACHKAYRIKKN